MQSPNRRYIPQVDEIRALAALLVFFFHAAILGYWSQGNTGWHQTRNPVVAIVLEGHSGVALFMVLSGFILAFGALDREISYAAFLRNRLLRIAPLVTVVVVFAVGSNPSVSLGQIFAPFFLMQNVSGVALPDPTNLTGMLWTVSIEFQFYLIAPFLFRAVREQGPLAFLLPATLLVLALRVFMILPHWINHTPIWSVPYFSIAGRLSQFFAGVALAAVFPALLDRSGPHVRRNGAVLVALGLVGMAIISMLINKSGGQYIWRNWRFVEPELVAVCWAAFIGGYLLLDPLSTFPKIRRAALWVGTVSFSLYVLHWPFIAFGWPALYRLGLTISSTPIYLAVAAVVLLPPALALSGLSYWTVEQPFLRRRQVYLAPGQTVRTPEPGPS